MTDLQIVYLLIGIVFVLMATQKARLDFIAIAVVLSLMITGVSTIEEALSGFGSPLVIIVIGLFIISEMLDKTGVTAIIGDIVLARGGKSYPKLVINIMIFVGIIGSFMSSTAVVALFIPIIMRISKATQLHHSLFLLPMSFASLISGMMTLIATTPNLVVNDELMSAGFKPFSFFSFTPLGSSVLAITIFYFVVFGKQLLTRERDDNQVIRTSHPVSELWEKFNRSSGSNESWLEVRNRYHKSTYGQKYSTSAVVGTTVLIHPDSNLISKNLKEIEFGTIYDIQVAGLQRNGEVLKDFKEISLQSPDILFLVGPLSQIQQVNKLHHEFIVLEAPEEVFEIPINSQRRTLSLFILGGMVALSAFNLVPLVTAVLLAAVAAIASNCLTADDAYKSVKWSNVVLIAGLLPLADAFERAGGTQLIAETLIGSIGNSNPRIILTALFFVTSAAGLFLSNTAAAILVAPVAILIAQSLSLSPYPFALAVAMAASAAFVTPISTPVVTLVVEPGNYSFKDFIKIGTPVLLFTYFVTVLLAPIVFPF